MPENSRILELRRRVQTDPASIAFAQLAEELRRAGNYDEGVGVCRAGLKRHPGYLSARVTLGRTLIEIGQLDEAAHELETVIVTAPDNLAAIRGLAEIKQRQGAMPEALAYYKRALELARHDPELEEAVERITQVVEPPVPAPEMAPTSVEELFDFDRLLAQLGVPNDPPAAPAAAAAPEPAAPAEPTPAVAEPVTPGPSGTAAEDSAEDSVDPFAELENQLREREGQVAPVLAAATARDPEDERVLKTLDGWLSAITADRV